MKSILYILCNIADNFVLVVSENIFFLPNFLGISWSVYMLSVCLCVCMFVCKWLLSEPQPFIVKVEMM